VTDVATLLFPSAVATPEPTAANALVPVASALAAVQARQVAPGAGGEVIGKDVAANLIYGGSSALSARHGEPAAQASDFNFAIPDGWGDTPADRAERALIAQGMSAAGASVSVGNELWSHIVAAAERPVTITEADSMAVLRKEWGSRTVSMVDIARQAVLDLAAVYPQVRAYLEHTNLGNDPELVKKIVAAVGRRR
jgi:hypothetical protein